MNDDEPIDSTAVEEVDGQENAAAGPPGGAVAVIAPAQGSVMRPLNTEELVESFRAYQALRGQLLTSDDYQDAGRGKSFVKKSGWRKIATAFGLNLEIMRCAVERDADGEVQRAEVIARAIAPNGRFADGDGYCSLEEDRFSGPRGNKAKLENDLRATATTRATNRAISNLVGMGEVSAEEASGGADAGPPFGEAANKTQEDTMLRALTFLGDGNPKVGLAAFNAVGMKLGYIPQAVALAIIAAAKVVRDSQDNDPQDNNNEAEESNAGDRAGEQHDG